MSIPQRDGSIDGVRGIAVLLVFFSHTSGRGMSLHPALDFRGLGHIGVYLFFCLSAFLLAGKLFEEGIDGNSVKRFYLKRFLRIVPLYYVVLIGVFLVQQHTGSMDEQFLHIKHGTSGFLQHLIFYRGDGVFWSVVVEEQFYILVPLWIFLFIRFPRVSIVGFGLIMVGNFLLYTSRNIQWPWATDAIRYVTTNDRDTGNYVDVFLCTIILVFVASRNRAFIQAHKAKLALIANSLFLAMIACTLVLVSRHFLWFQEELRGFRYLSLLYAFVFSVFIISVSVGNPVNRWLTFAPLRYFGIFGFSVYLLHFFVFKMVLSLGFTGPAGFLLSGAGIFLLSFVTYYTIEKPCIKLAYRLIDKWGLGSPVNRTTGK